MFTRVSYAALMVTFLGLMPPAAAQVTSPQLGRLVRGPYAVGFRVIQQRDYSRTVTAKKNYAGIPAAGETAAPMQIGLWYPADPAPASEPMRFDEYLYLAQIAETGGEITDRDRDRARDALRGRFRFAFTRDPSEPELQSILSMRTAAIRDAKPARGEFPALVCGLGTLGGASVLAEYLASHGYVVATTARHAEMATLQATKPQIALEWHTRSFEYVLGFLRERRIADLTRVGLLGVNFDGLAALNLQMRSLAADAVVSLDGWEGKVSSSTIARQSPWFDVLRARVPYLVFAHDRPPNPGLQFDRAFFDGLKYSQRYAYQVADVEHFDYIANPLVLPSLSTAKRRGVEFVYRTVLHFLNAYVRNDRDSLAFLARGAVANGYDAAMLKIEQMQASLKPAPTVEEFEQLLGVGLGQSGTGVKQGIEVFRAAQRDNPDLRLFSVSSINLFAFRMKQQNNREAALDLLRLGVEAYPSSAAAMSNVCTAYQEFGQTDDARSCFEKAGTLVATDPALSDAERAEMRRSIAQTRAALKTK